jgi:hypothetical protein
MESRRLISEIIRGLKQRKHRGNDIVANRALDNIEKTLAEIVYPELKDLESVWHTCTEATVPRYKRITINSEDKIEIEPFQHDCQVCIWMGWIWDGNIPVNMYFCPGKPERGDGKDLGTIIWRYSDKPSDYRSRPVWKSNFSKPGGILMNRKDGEEMLHNLKERADWYKEQDEK